MSPAANIENILRGLRLVQLAPEVHESPANNYKKMAQRFKDGMALERYSIAEKYAHGSFALVCDLNISPRGRNADEIEAVHGSCQFEKAVRFARLVFVADVPDVLEMDLGDEEFVLVENVESVKLPDGSPIPSLVRLYHVQDEVADPFGGLMFESAVDGVFHFIPGVINRKLGELGALAGGGKLDVAGCVVESGSEIMKRVSDDAHDTFRHPFKRDDMKGIVSSIRIVLDGDFVRMASLEGGEFLVEFQDVLSGPLDL